MCRHTLLTTDTALEWSNSGRPIARLGVPPPCCLKGNIPRLITPVKPYLFISRRAKPLRISTAARLIDSCLSGWGWAASASSTLCAAHWNELWIVFFSQLPRWKLADRRSSEAARMSSGMGTFHHLTWYEREGKFKHLEATNRVAFTASCKEISQTQIHRLKMWVYETGWKWHLCWLYSYLVTVFILTQEDISMTHHPV